VVGEARKKQKKDQMTAKAMVAKTEKESQG